MILVNAAAAAQAMASHHQALAVGCMLPFRSPCSSVPSNTYMTFACPAGCVLPRYWNQIDFTGKQLAFADGGSADNLVITPLLRRRITKIIATVAASQNVTATANSSDFAGYQYDVAALFGACPPTHPAYDKKGTIVGTPPDLFNRKLQVGYNLVGCKTEL